MILEQMSEITLLSPAGSFESLQAALDNGADAVYFGVGQLNMRSRATVNFTEDDLPEIVQRCHEKNVKAWLALNIIVYDSELDEIRRLCNAARTAGVDAIIALDISVIRAAHAAGLSVHISVQANISNIEAVRFYAQYADVIVLARELTLEQIGDICRAIREEGIRGPSGQLLEVEIFTGVTHQIRAQLAAAGMHIVNDRLYGAFAVENQTGHCLHALAAKFRHPASGDETEIRTPLPHWAQW